MNHGSAMANPHSLNWEIKDGRSLAVAGCTLDDVVSSECWMTDPRDFMAFNAIYKTYFKSDPPVRSIFPMRFMFNCKNESCGL